MYIHICIYVYIYRHIHIYIYNIYKYTYIITARKNNTANDSISSSNKNISDYGDEVIVILKYSKTKTVLLV